MKKLFSIVIFGLMLSTLFSPVVSATDKNVSFSNQINLESLDGEIYSPNDQNKLNRGPSATIENFHLHQQNGQVNIKGILTYKNKKQDLTTSGSLYPLVNAGGASDGKLILGDMKETDSFNVLQFKIEKGNSPDLKTNDELTIILEDRKNGQLIRFQKVIPEGEFSDLFKGAQQLVENENLKRDNLLSEIVSLMNIKNKAEHQNQEPKSLEVKLDGTANSKGKIATLKPEATIAWQDIPVEYVPLNTLLKDLKTKPYRVNIRDYHVSESIFKGDGWKSYTSIGAGGDFHFAAITTGTGRANESMTQISMIDLVVKRDPQDKTFVVQHTVKHGLVVKYDHTSGELELQLRDFGLHLKDWQIGFDNLRDQEEDLENDRVFLHQISMGYMDNPPSAIAYFATKLPWIGEIYDFWTKMVFMDTRELNGMYTFDDYEQQIRKDELVKGIGLEFGKGKLRSETNRVGLLGRIHNYDLGWTLRWGSQFSVSTDL